MGVRATYRFFCSCLLAVVFYHAFGQSSQSALNLTTADGLSQGVVFDILQDREGFMWFGTKGGLNRYDGYNFEVYSNDPEDPWSISANTVVALFEDSKGRIWASIDDKGVDIYDKKTGRFHHIHYKADQPGGITGTHIISITEDDSGYFLLNIDRREINMLKLEDAFFEEQQPPQVIRIPIPKQSVKEQEPTSILRGISKDAAGRIWVGGPDVIYELDVPKAALRLAEEGVFIGATVSSSDGTLWSCGHRQPLFKWDGNEATHIAGDFDGVIQFARGNDHVLWAVCADTLYAIDEEKLLNEKAGQYIKDAIIYRWWPGVLLQKYPLHSVAVDQSGIVWVGSNGYGLFQINPRHAHLNHKLSNISTRQFAILSESHFYVNTHSGWFASDTLIGMNFLNPSNVSVETDYILVTADSNFWIRQIGKLGNSYMLINHSAEREEKRQIPIPWVHYDAQPMIETRDAYMWLTGFDQMLTRVDPLTGRLQTFDISDGKKTSIDPKSPKVISNNYSTAIYEDQAGILWVGTEAGMIRCERSNDPQDDLKVTHYKNEPYNSQSLSYNHVSCFLDDPLQPERYLWISTKGGGLNRFDKRAATFRRFTQADGLPDHVVYGLLADEQGNLWGSTNKGLFCLLRQSIQDETYAFRNFSQNDGLQADEFNTGSYAKLPGGKLMFGGVNGYNVFDPAELLTAAYQPPVYISDILVNNERIRPFDASGILSASIPFQKEITLLPKHEILTLEFASLDYTASDRNRYRYQLIGADDNWVEADKQRSATFLQLSPKTYTFRVQGTNSHGVWSEHIAELIIHVLPPWYKSWWAYLCYLILLFLIVFTGLRFYIKREKLSQQLAFEKREADRIRELEAQKNQLYMNMTHEFRTPLTIILGMAKQLKEKAGNSTAQDFNLIIRNGQNLLGLVNKILSLSKLESGNIQFEWVYNDVILFLKSLLSSYQNLLEQKEIQLHFLPEVDTLYISYDPEKIQQILSNLISNAYKFTPEGGHIYLMVKAENRQLVLRVKDTGIGIHVDKVAHIFDRFYQGDSSTTRQHEGSGIGLALTKELVTILGGSIQVQSPPMGASVGTEFMIQLPLRSNDKTASSANSPDLRNTRSVQIPVLDPAPNISKTHEQITDESPVHPYSSVAHQSLYKQQSVILLVEDNADVTTYVASCLSEITATNELIVAENGQEGLKMAVEVIPDLIISDVMMPIMDGFEMCRRLKADPRTDHIPVIMLTARADIQSKIEGLEIGANAYLPKPFERQELLLTVKNLFQLRQSLRKRFQEQLIGSSPPMPQLTNKQQAEDSWEIEDKFVAQVTAIIESKLSDFDLSVGHIAKDLHLSHSQLARKIDALTGYSPNRLIRLIRLKKAKELLADEQLSITAIAYDCGFNDPSYFSRIFKKTYGVSPSEWRSRNIDQS